MTVKGPFSYPDWITLKQVKESLAYMKENNNQGKYDIAIAKEKDLYKSILKEPKGTND